MTEDDVSNPAVPAVEIPLSEMSETTKDFLLAASAAGKSVTEVIAEQLDRAASAAGFSTGPTSNSAAA